jgi:hypothetical protein
MTSRHARFATSPTRDELTEHWIRCIDTATHHTGTPLREILQLMSTLRLALRGHPRECEYLEQIDRWRGYYLHGTMSHGTIRTVLQARLMQIREN